MSKAKKQKRFQYPLETLLKVREIREKQEQEKFQKAEEKVAEELRKEEEIKNIQAQAYLELQDMMIGDNIPDMNIIQLRKHQLEDLKEKVAEQIQARENAEKERDEQRENLNKAIKERKIIEKDKDKTKEKWRKIMDKEDAKFMDDIAGINYAKKLRENQE
jgi:flagellar FliJ protein